ncbi:MAG: DUF4097 family beta strand repeat-containing protein, partial [Halanaerobiaceae bacterium]
MRKLILVVGIISLVFIFTSTAAAIRETRRMSLTPETEERFVVDAGAGDLHIEQRDELEEVTVKAVISVENVSDDKFKEITEEKMELCLEKSGNSVYLDSYFTSDSGFFEYLFGETVNGSIDLKVEIPGNFNSITVEDGSGDIILDMIEGEVEIDDGSGDIETSNSSGNWEVEDGSGDIRFNNHSGKLSINDGSGDIRIFNCNGDFEVNDGSGDIVIDNQHGRLKVNDGSGDIQIRNLSDSV